MSRFGAGHDDEDTVGLVDLAGDLGHQLGGGDADRGGESVREVGDVGADLCHDRLDPFRVEVRGRIEVDERLVERQWLDQLGLLAQRAMTRRLASRYASKRPPRNAACGHRARASAVRIAERTP